MKKILITVLILVLIGSAWGASDYLYIKATAQSEGDLHLSDGSNWGAFKATISMIRVVTSSTDWDLYVLQNDNGYSTNDATIPRLMVANEIEGNANLLVNLPYEDEDASGEVHLYYLDNSGANAADIYILGYMLEDDPNAGYISGSIYDANLVNTGWCEYIDATHICATGMGSHSFIVFDISDPDSPTITDQIVDATYLGGAEDIWIDSTNDVAYITATTVDRITAIDISDLENLSLVANGSLQDSTNLDGIEALDIKTYGDQTIAVCCAFYGDMVTTVNITDPTNMVVLDTVSDPNIEEPIYVQIEGDVAYVTSRAASYFLSIDITDPNNISIKDDLFCYQATTCDIDAAGDYAFVTSPMFSGIYVVDITDPDNLSETASVGDTARMYRARVCELVNDDYVAVTGYGNNTIGLIDVSDRANPVVMPGYVIDDVLMEGPDDIRWINNRLYITVREGERLSVVRFPFLEN